MRQLANLNLLIKLPQTGLNWKSNYW